MTEFFLVLATVASLLAPALSQVNQAYQELEKEYQIQLAQENIDPKEPIHLKAVYHNGKEVPIGVIHMIRLDQNIDAVDWKEIALNVDQIREAIFARADLFFSASQDPNIYVVKETGQLLDFGDCDVKVEEDGTFSVFGREVKWQHGRLKVSNICSQYITHFTKLSNQHVTLTGEGDTRPGKGIFIDLDGNIYRGDSLN